MIEKWGKILLIKYINKNNLPVKKRISFMIANSEVAAVHWKVYALRYADLWLRIVQVVLWKVGEHAERAHMNLNSNKYMYQNSHFNTHTHTHKT